VTADELAEFKDASEAAQRFLDWFTMAETCAKEGRFGEAMEFLKGFGALTLTDVSNVIVSRAAETARHGDCTVLPSVRDGHPPFHYASAHAAWDRLSSLCFTFTQVERDPADCTALVERYAGVASGIRAGMVRERAKVLAEARPAVATKTPAREKRGPKGTAERDAAIAKEFYDGHNADPPLWRSQVEYLKARHKTRWKKNARNAKSWLSQLLDRTPYNERAGDEKGGRLD
jgi:hypothetical protein